MTTTHAHEATSSIVSIDLNGLEARIFVEPSSQGLRAYSILFDDNADVINETESIQYIGYCLSCVAYRVACDLFDYRKQVEPFAIADSLEADGLSCHCDD